jgi:AraC-like DNA-binding protein
MPDLPIEAAEKVLAAAEAAGVARDALLAAAGIAEAGARISYGSLCALYEAAARLTGDGAFGLHIGERTAPRMYGRLGYVAANSETLGDALAGIVEFQPLWSQAVGVEIRRRSDWVALRYWHRGAIAPADRRQESEQMLAALLAFARGASQGPVDPLEIRFEHGAPADTGEHRRIFGAPIVFRAPVTEMVLPMAALALPLPQADAALAQLIREQALPALAEQSRREPFLDRLGARLQAAILDAREPRLSEVAAAMEIGSRTLQRRLRRHGLTFRGLADQLRIELAKTMLGEASLALGQIAFRLGYSQTSAFHRAFRRHAGATPGAFRRALRAHEERV